MASNVPREFTPSFESLSMEDIIGAPLVATAQANSEMAREQVQFLMDFCFAKQGNDEASGANDEVVSATSNYKPVMVQMEVTRSDIVPSPEPGGTPSLVRVKSTFEVPLLTLIPINSLAVNEVTVEFEMEVTAVEQTKSTEQSTSKTSSKRRRPKLMGKVGAKTKSGNQQVSQENQRKTTSNVSINVKASPLPLPVGLTNIIDLYSKNLSPSNVETVSDQTLADTDS